MDTLFIIDGRPAYIELLESRLREQASLKRIMRFSSITEYCQNAPLVKPALLVTGIRYEDGNGFDLCRSFLGGSPGNTVLFWADQFGAPALLEAFESGAAGMVYRRQKLNHIVKVIVDVLQGKSVWTCSQLFAMHQWRNVILHPLSSLTVQEESVATSIALRHTNREIAEALRLSERTVEGYVSRTLDKLEFENRTALAQWAEQIGWDTWIRFRRTLRDFRP